MSSRYSGTHDSRYTPRDRSRSPPRYSDRRASTAYQPGFPPVDIPRGPKALVDAPRPSGPGNSSSVPAGPRGRGLGGRQDYRDSRDLPPSSSERERSWRDREYDRRDRRPSPRGRSPSRDFRDTRDYPRDLDTARTRRESRDGPPSASSTYSDPPPFSSSSFGRAGFGRGRGRGDYEYHGRGRGLYPDERDVFRPRSRSRGPLRREKEFLRDDRDFDRVEEHRYDRYEEERRSERDDRDRDRERERDRDRDFDRQRRELGPSRLDLRQGSTSAGPSTPHPLTASSSHPLLERPAAPSTPRDATSARRGSAGILPPPQKEIRRESDRPDYFTSRAEASREKYPQRAESPPPQAPQVPAFGSLPQFKTSTYSGPPSNVWRAPVENKPAELTQATLVAPQPPKDAPVAPSAQLNVAPPTGPRSSRPFSERSSAGDSTESASTSLQDAKVKDGTTLSRPTTPRPTPPLKSTTTGQANATRLVTHQPKPTAIALTGPRAPPSGPPSAARATAASYSYNKSPAQTPVRPSTPPNPVPIGPRSAPQPNTSPKALGINVPTGPRSNRVNVPTNSRANFSYRLPRNQWIRPGLQPYGSTVVPAKRDSTGEEVAKGENGNSRDVSKAEPSLAQQKPPKMEQSDEVINRISPVPPSVEHEGNQSQPVSDKKPVQEDGKMDIDEEPHPALANSRPDATPPADTGGGPSDEDDGLDLDEEDFVRTKDGFEKDKDRLEASKIELSARNLRSTTPLRQIATLARIAHVNIEDVKFFVPDPSRDRTVFSEQRPVRQSKARKTAQTSMLTPKAEDSEDTAMSDDNIYQDVSPNRMSSPDPKSLPYLSAAPPTPLSDHPLVQENLAQYNKCKSNLADYFVNHAQELEKTSEHICTEYARLYKPWKIHILSLDREKELAEKERQKSVEPGPPPEPALPPTTPVTESRRAHKFNTDYDVERALKESIDTHREEQEKAKREASQAKADLSKEAPIPPMLDQFEQNRTVFKDTNNLRNPADLTSTYGFVPPKDTFTQEEHEILVHSYHQFPKKWGRIAEELKPRRSYKECINHYYATKWNGEYKDNRSKTGRRGGRVPRGRAAKGQPRGKSNALISGMDTKPDLYEGNEYQIPTVSTESGRPRRAAAPINFATEKDSDGKQGTPAITPGRKTTNVSRFDGATDPPSQKPVKRQKGAAKEKGPGKRKAPAVALAPAGSPLKSEKLLEGRANDHTADDIPPMTSLEEASLLASLQTGPNQLNVEKSMPYLEMQSKPGISASTAAERPSTGGSEKPKLQGTTQQRTGASSYWSVPEVTDFPKNVAHFGTEWQAIANHMGTKTQTMVRNYYMRLIEGTRPDLVQAAALADQRRERGEDLGPPPIATPLTKRHYNNTQPTVPRPLAPNTDIVEIEDNSPLLKEQPQQSHQSPHHVPLDLRAPPANTNSTQPQVTPTTRPAPSSATHQTSLPPKRQSQQHGPPLGYFPEARAEGRSSVISVNAPSKPHLDAHGKPHHSVSLRREAPEDQFRRHVVAHEHPKETKAIEAQTHTRLQQQAQERGPPAPPVQQQVISRPPVEVTLVQPAPVDQHRIVELRRSPPPQQTLLQPRQPQLGLRHLIDLPSQVSHATSPINTPVSHAPPTPVSRDEARPHSVPTPASAPNSIAAPPPTAFRPAQEPRKTSNLASILNSEPEEPRLRKKQVEQIPPTTSMPMQPGLSHGFASTQVPSFARRDSQGESPMSQGSIQRDPFGRPIPHSTQATPRLAPEFLAREQARDNATRQDWASRSGYTASQRASSPQPQPLHDRMTESRPPFSHRSVFGPLNEQSRHNASPPPRHGYGHSRTPSYQQAQVAQPQSQQSPTPLSQSTQMLQPNPYAQQGPPPTATRAAGQAIQSRAQQQSPLPYNGPPHLSQTPHQRHMSLQHHREHEPISRQHEEQRERERERDQVQSHNAHSHTQNRYTPIQHSESRFPPPPRQTTPLQHYNPNQPPPPPAILQQHPSQQQHEARYAPHGSRDEERMRMEQQQQQQARWREEEEAARRRPSYVRPTDTRTPPGPGTYGGIFGGPR